MSSVFVITTNEFESKILRGHKYGDRRIKTYEKLGHAKGALTQMRNLGRQDTKNAIIVELPLSKGKVVQIG
jgi:hypothetical protein